MTFTSRIRPLALATLFSAGVLSGVLTPAASASADEPRDGVYSMSNAATGNTLLAFKRERDGTLHPNGSYPTGGNGTGSALGSGHSIAVSDDGREVAVVNPGSNSITAFRVHHNRLEQLGKPVMSGGTR